MRERMSISDNLGGPRKQGRGRRYRITISLKSGTRKPVPFNEIHSEKRTSVIKIGYFNYDEF